MRLTLPNRILHGLSLAAVVALVVLGAGCPGEQKGEPQMEGPPPPALTIGYVGDYRGFHRPCG